MLFRFYYLKENTRVFDRTDLLTFFQANPNVVIEKKNDMNAERKTKMVSELIEMGKKSGVLSYKDIMDKLADIQLEPAQIERVYEILEKSGINATVRRTLGSDINASCGQLRRGEKN